MIGYLMNVGAASGLVMVWATEVPSDPLSYIVDIGISGIIIFLLIIGKLHTNAAMSAKDETITLLREALHDLTASTNQQAIPALSQSVQAMKERPLPGLNRTQLEDLITKLEVFLDHGGT